MLAIVVIRREICGWVRDLSAVSFPRNPLLGVMCGDGAPIVRNSCFSLWKVIAVQHETPDPHKRIGSNSGKRKFYCYKHCSWELVLGYSLNLKNFNSFIMGSSVWTYWYKCVRNHCKGTTNLTLKVTCKLYVAKYILFKPFHVLTSSVSAVLVLRKLRSLFLRIYKDYFLLLPNRLSN